MVKRFGAVRLIVYAALVGGCGSDDDKGSICDQAYQKSKDCGVTVTSTPPECTAPVECVSKCIVTAPCDQLTSDAETNDFIVCASKCQ
jgi:hypothetical protein